MNSTKGDYPSQQRQQIVFRLDDDVFIEFKKQLLENGNMKVQSCLEKVVKQIISGKIEI
jgi:hypothetical protein